MGEGVDLEKVDNDYDEDVIRCYVFVEELNDNC